MLRASAQAQAALAIPAVGAGRFRRRGRGRARLDGLRRRGAQAQVVRGLHARGARGAAPHHGQDPAHAAAPADPAQRVARSSGPRPDPGGPSGSPCACTGEPARLYWRRRKVRLRPLVLILDISGSMADYSRSLLQFAHSAANDGRSAGRVEVFCFGTRLTRVTGAMDCLGARTRRWNGRRGPPSTGTAGPGSGTAWTPSSAAGRAAGCAGAASW